MDTVQRSNFVTVVSWIFIVLSGFALIFSVFQNIMLTVMMHGTGIGSSSGTAGTGPGSSPWPMDFLFAHFRLFLLLHLVLFSLALASSIGLLKRKNWARILFIAVLVTGICYLVFIIVFSCSLMSLVHADMKDDISQQFRVMTYMVRVFIMLLYGIPAGLFAWIIRKLATRPVKDEFITTGQPSRVI